MSEPDWIVSTPKMLESAQACLRRLAGPEFGYGTGHGTSLPIRPDSLEYAAGTVLMAIRPKHYHRWPLRMRLDAAGVPVLMFSGGGEGLAARRLVVAVPCKGAMRWSKISRQYDTAMTATEYATEASELAVVFDELFDWLGTKAEAFVYENANDVTNRARKRRAGKS